MSGGPRRPRLSTGAWIGSQAAPYLAPWLVVLTAMPVASVLRLVIGDEGGWMLVLGVMFTLMTAGTWLTWKSRRHETRVTVTVFTGAVLLWTGLAAGTTPWDRDMVIAWALGGMSLSAFWDIRHAGVVGGHDKDTVKEDKGDGWLGQKIAAFKDSRVPKDGVKDNGQELRVRHNLDAPTTAADAQRAAEQIAAVAGVGKDQVKVIKVKGDESKVDVVLTRAQDTSKPLVYRGPSAPGQSCAAAPLWLGRRTDGSDIEWWMAGSTDPRNPRNVTHSKTTGVTGSGKTETVCTAILDMRWRTDIVPVVGDPAKFQQGFGDIAECLGLAARTRDEVVQLIANLREVIEYRSDLLGSLTRADGLTGYKQWEPECWTLHQVPFLFIDIEEAADVLSGYGTEEDIYEAVRKLRSLGIKLNVSMQTMPHDDIPRKVRGQFSESLAHGQNEYQDAKYSLSGESLEAGADPTCWGPNVPGSLFAEVTGTDKTHWPVGGRSVYMSLAEKQMSMTGSRQYWAEIDPGTYGRLARGIDPAFPLVPGVDGEGEGFDDEEGIMQEVPMDPFAGVSGADPQMPLTPPRPGLEVSFDDPGPKSGLSTEDARRRLSNRLEVLARSGQMDVTFEDLADIPAEVGRTPGWVYNNLKLLVEAGVLTEYQPPQGKKIYRIIRRTESA
jgi:hypothetical protein